jgi:uncharacterized protein (TIGR02246 family)
MLRALVVQNKSHGISFAVSLKKIMQAHTLTIPGVEEQNAVQALYKNLIQSWNHLEADEFSALFYDDGHMIGFDGSQAHGKEEIKDHLSQIFADHKPARFVTIIREVRFLSPTTALLSAVAGMVHRGQTEIKPENNAIQSMLAVKEGDEFHIALFQNTPAQFHGRPEMAEQLTRELQAAVK